MIDFIFDRIIGNFEKSEINPWSLACTHIIVPGVTTFLKLDCWGHGVRNLIPTFVSDKYRTPRDGGQGG